MELVVTEKKDLNSRLTSLQTKRDEIDQQIKLLERSIFFFENIVTCNRQDMPELEQFKDTLKKAQMTRKGLDLALTSCAIKRETALY